MHQELRKGWRLGLEGGKQKKKLLSFSKTIIGRGAGEEETFLSGSIMEIKKEEKYKAHCTYFSASPYILLSEGTIMPGEEGRRRKNYLLT